MDMFQMAIVINCYINVHGILNKIFFQFPLVYYGNSSIVQEAIDIESIREVILAETLFPQQNTSTFSGHEVIPYWKFRQKYLFYYSLN